MRKPSFLLITFLLLLSPGAFAIELGAVADSRFETGWTLDGDAMTTTRAKLLDPANFGPGGTVDEVVNITDVDGEITYIALSTFDIFLIGFLNNNSDNHFTEDELVAMADWVAAGGTMIVGCDLSNYDTVCLFLGAMIGDVINGPVVPTGPGATRPPFDGPFGQPTELDTYGNASVFDDTGGYSVMAEDQDGDPVILEAFLGDGRIIMMGDIDMISNFTLSEGTGIENDNDQFLGNLVAYLGSVAEETFVFNPGVNGNWWDSSRSGEGAQLELLVTGEVYTLFVTFYSYDDEGNQIFLVAIGVPNGNEVELTVFITDGGLWGDDFDPGLVNETEFGSGNISFSSCGMGHLVITPNAEYQAQGYEEIEYDITRLGVPAAPCPVSNF